MSDTQDRRRPDISNIPIPDPTVLTSATIAQAVKDLREDFKDRLSEHTKLLEEKLKGLEIRFTEYKSGAEKAIDKSGGKTDAQIDGLKELITAAQTRLDRMESASLGARNTRDESRANITVAVVVGGFIFAIGSGLVSGLVGYNLGGRATALAVPTRADPIYIAPIAPAPAPK
jgi:chromosome segregation ATPase